MENIKKYCGKPMEIECISPEEQARIRAEKKSSCEKVRDYLFRAKTLTCFCGTDKIESGKWAYGLIDYDWLNYEYIIHGKDGGGVALVDPETICEFSGKTDKNDKKIFEYDIIKCDGVKGYGKVFFSTQFAMWLVAYKSDFSMNINLGNLENIEIVGNAFDNPELLGDKK